MPYLIDSDWVIDHLSDVQDAAEPLSRLAAEGIAISIITYMEVYQGVIRSPDPVQAQERFDALLEGIVVLPFSLSVARRCAQLRNHLKEQGKRVNARALDLIIAATALEYNLTLVTRNIADYDDIPDLELYTR
ncbi:type II toxin-antitoxin system VapC family toxin [Litorilinea aerophila]|uniref:Ribonuclease VapC n=1 Tax=Litorilinea aerophila TaxID=1204385 RepID=A0A540VG90_9CHLR|nr:type II toxin-antitoxin system VapC family toxin [Litorilinea aerophila]MCC9076443.1 type II toxin-antitoxin system VapC family toxin [Litorilinea aerophila]